MGILISFTDEEVGPVQANMVRWQCYQTMSKWPLNLATIKLFIDPIFLWGLEELLQISEVITYLVESGTGTMKVCITINKE
jgi:hypothetical protein